MSSVQAGYVPIPLEHVQLRALPGVAVYLRSSGAAATDDGEAASFALYCGASVPFTETHRHRLMEHGARFIYIRVADHQKFSSQTRAQLDDLAGDPTVSIAARSAMVYETSIELMNELLTEPEMLARSPQVAKVSRAVATLVIADRSAFSHLYVASHHDFYTATHMVNVATSMVALAYELGRHDPDELALICQAGLLHDMGKMVIPEAILNKVGKLTEDEWAVIRRHPMAGCEYLTRCPNIDPLVFTVTRQHHERLDGSGYPARLRGEQIHPVSMICAVADSFDAMTAFRPFKERTLSPREAMGVLRNEAGSKLDAEVVEAWSRLIRRVEPATLADPGAVASAIALLDGAPGASDRRGTASTLIPGGTDGAAEKPGEPVVVHSDSGEGIGFLCRAAMPAGTRVRLRLGAAGQRVVDGHITRCCVHRDGWHEIGMRVEAGSGAQRETLAA